jgi:hypothetical protein
MAGTPLFPRSEAIFDQRGEPLLILLDLPEDVAGESLWGF